MGFDIGGAIIGGLTSLLGGAQANETNRDIANITTDKNHQMANEANAFSAAEADKNRAWQEQMSNSAYQRSTVDMAAAGLNPMLAGMNRSGASTPSGNAASGTAGRAEGAHVDNILGPAFNSAMSAAGVLKDLQAKDSGIMLNAALTSKAAADGAASVASAKKLGVDTTNMENMLDANAKTAKAAAAKAEYDLKFSKWDAYAGRASRELGTASKVKDLFSLPKVEDLVREKSPSSSGSSFPRKSSDGPEGLLP